MEEKQAGQGEDKLWGTILNGLFREAWQRMCPVCVLDG